MLPSLQGRNIEFAFSGCEYRNELKWVLITVFPCHTVTHNGKKQKSRPARNLRLDDFTNPYQSTKIV